MMSVQKKSLLRGSAKIACFLSLFLVSCSSPEVKQDSGDAAMQTPVSDTPLLAEGEGGDANGAALSTVPANISEDDPFADLKSEASASKKKTPKHEESTVAASVSSDNDSGMSSPLLSEGDSVSAASVYYDALGGESLGRVAYTVYGSKQGVKKLLSLNDSIAPTQKLDAGQKVFFDMDTAKPVVFYLTKGLVERYSAQLSDRVEREHEAEGAPKKSVTVERGDTLQKISQRLYGTSRLWTELYLVNKTKLDTGFDKIAVGTELTYYEYTPQLQAAAVGSVASTNNYSDDPPTKKSRPSVDKIVPVEPVASAVQASAPVVSHAEAATPPSDPIPDMSSQEPVAAPAASNLPPAVAAATQPVASPAQKPYEPKELSDSGSGNMNFRRILYVALIVLVGAVSFIMTRPKKKKFDMSTLAGNEPANNSRPKFQADNQDRGVG